MQTRTRLELYHSFLNFIGHDLQKERYVIHRRLMNVFFWCFFFPACLSISVLIFVKLKWLPRSAKAYMDGLVLAIPIIYSLYFLSLEVLAQVPAAVKRGGIANNLTQAVREGEWRERVCEGLERGISASEEEWSWIAANFSFDLKTLLQRTRFLTGLSGAVFFLIIQGIDSISENEVIPEYVIKGHAIPLRVVQFNDLTQYVGLGLFLTLFYLAGSQTYYSLLRYLNCAELMTKKKSGKSRS